MKFPKFKSLAIVLLLAGGVVPAQGQGLSRLIGGVKKVAQAYKLSDKDVQEYVHQYITDLDSKSTICPETSPYTLRLKKLTQGITDVDGVPLNFKVYQTQDVNAFACADGSVRVYTGLMDLMTDDEVLGVIGHEVGHVAHHDSKEAFKNALLTSALKDGLASTSSKVAILTDSQLGALGEKLINAKYSRSQEQNADDYGYDFLKKNGKNPYAMAMAFEKLQSLEGATGQKSNYVKNLFSDHPETQKRIKHMIERATADGYTRPTAQSASSKTSKSTTTKKSTKSTKKTTKKSSTKKSTTKKK